MYNSGMAATHQVMKIQGAHVGISWRKGEVGSAVLQGLVNLLGRDRKEIQAQETSIESCTVFQNGN